MNYVYPSHPMEAWTWIYLLTIFIGLLSLLGATVVTSRVHPSKQPWFIVPLAAVGTLYTIAFSVNLGVLYLLTAAMAELGAPIASMVLAVIVTVFCWCLSCRMMFYRNL